MSAQTSSAALAQSIRSLNLSPLTTPENSRGKSYPESLSTDNARLNTRITELEEILRKSDAKARKREDENAKLRDTLAKYREKWDNLKAGAKARRERATAASSSPSEGGTNGPGKEKGNNSTTAVEGEDDVM